MEEPVLEEYEEDDDFMGTGSSDVLGDPNMEVAYDEQEELASGENEALVGAVVTDTYASEESCSAVFDPSFRCREALQQLETCFMGRL